MAFSEAFQHRYAYKDGNYIISGDAGGNLKVWDCRKVNQVVSMTEVQSTKTSNLIPSITGIAASPSQKYEEEGKYFAVNCSDNGKKFFFFPENQLKMFFPKKKKVLRIYDRGIQNNLIIMDSINSTAANSKLKLVKNFFGHKNKNWPIKSSFYIGKHCNEYQKESPFFFFFSKIISIKTGYRFQNDPSQMDQDLKK